MEEERRKELNVGFQKSAWLTKKRELKRKMRPDIIETPKLPGRNLYLIYIHNNKKKKEKARTTF